MNNTSTSLLFIRGFFNKNEKILAFLSAFSILLCAQYTLDVDKFYYDSALYWALGDPSNFQGATVTTRGYIFPTLIYLIRNLTDISAHPILSYGIIASGIYSILLTSLIPECFISIFGGSISFFRRITPTLLLAFFFPGLIFYPLSDFPALIFTWISLYFVYKMMRIQPLSKASVILFSFSAGCLCMSAYNIRPIYIFSLPIISILAFKFGRQYRFTALTSLLIGMFCIGLPQAFINHRINNEFTPLVTFPMGKNSLFSAQLLAGVTVQRYETSRITGSLAHLDPAGLRLVENVRDDFPIFTFPEYVKGVQKSDAEVKIGDFFGLIGKFPFEFFGIYVRHTVNGLDARDGDIYVEKSTADRNVRSALNLLVLSIALFIFLSDMQSRLIFQGRPGSFSIDKALTVFILFAPSLAIIPGAVETRFFLPIQLFSYFYVAFKSDLNGTLKTFSLKIPIIICIFIIYCLSFSISIQSFSNN